MKQTPKKKPTVYVLQRKSDGKFWDGEYSRTH